MRRSVEQRRDVGGHWRSRSSRADGTALHRPVEAQALHHDVGIQRAEHGELRRLAEPFGLPVVRRLQHTVGVVRTRWCRPTGRGVGRRASTAPSFGGTRRHRCRSRPGAARRGSGRARSSGSGSSPRRGRPRGRCAAASSDRRPELGPEHLATPRDRPTSRATAGRSSGRRNTSTRSGTPGRSASDGYTGRPRISPLAGVHEPHVEVAARRQQVGGRRSRLARLRVGRDMPTMATRAGAARIARRWHGARGRDDRWLGHVIRSPWPPRGAPGRGPTGCRRRPRARPRAGSGRGRRRAPPAPRRRAAGAWSTPGG